VENLLLAVGIDAVNLSAGNNLTIGAVTDTVKESSSASVTKKGFTGGFSAGVLSVGYGKSSSASQGDLAKTIQVGSIVASVGGNTRLQAGEQLSVVASDIGAGKDLTLIGKNVTLVAAQETVAQKDKVSTLQAGGDLTILATGGNIASEGAHISAEDNATLIAREAQRPTRAPARRIIPT
jgi:filamentous hemagglutinin